MLRMVFPLVGLISSSIPSITMGWDTVYLGFLSIPFGLAFASVSGVVVVFAVAFVLGWLGVPTIDVGVSINSIALGDVSSRSLVAASTRFCNALGDFRSSF